MLTSNLRDKVNSLLPDGYRCIKGFIGDKETNMILKGSNLIADIGWSTVNLEARVLEAVSQAAA